jgi:hypothetical protein
MSWRRWLSIAQSGDGSATFTSTKLCGLPRSGRPTQRLSDVVYWRTHAVPGELIQERSGGMVLVTRAGTLHPIRFSAPEPLHVETAFTHTERAHGLPRPAFSN